MTVVRFSYTIQGMPSVSSKLKFQAYYPILVLKFNNLINFPDFLESGFNPQHYTVISEVHTSRDYEWSGQYILDGNFRVSKVESHPEGSGGN
jgi:hypothetical protein